MQNRTPLTLLVLAPVLISACAPYSGYYRDGQSVARLNADQTGCEVLAVNSVPPDKRVRTTPLRVVPGETVCNSEQVCVTSAPQVFGGEIYTVDANAGLRNRVAAQCMIDKGYRKVSVPACTPAVAKEAVARAPQVLPPLTGNVCAARSPDQGYVFVATVPASRAGTP